VVSARLGDSAPRAGIKRTEWPCPAASSRQFRPELAEHGLFKSGEHSKAGVQWSEGVPDVRPSSVCDAHGARGLRASAHVRSSRARLAGGGTRPIADADKVFCRRPQAPLESGYRSWLRGSVTSSWNREGVPRCRQSQEGLRCRYDTTLSPSQSTPSLSMISAAAERETVQGSQATPSLVCPTRVPRRACLSASRVRRYRKTAYTRR
jgi:hypothetical protein